MSQLVDSPCAKCHAAIPSILAGEFCPGCGKAVHKKCKTPARDDPRRCRSCGLELGDTMPAPSVAPDIALPASAPAQPASPSAPLRVNRFNFRVTFGGAGCALLGLWWTIDALAGGTMDSVIGGLIWKGPLLMTAGVAAVYYGYRMMSDADAPK